MKKKQYKTTVILIGFVVFLLAGDVMAARMDTEKEQRIPQEYGQRRGLHQDQERVREAGRGIGREAERGPNQRRGQRERLGRGREDERGIGREVERGPNQRRGQRERLGRGREDERGIDSERRQGPRQRRGLRQGSRHGPAGEQEYPPEIKPDIEN